jgi:ribonuclease HI
MPTLIAESNIAVAVTSRQIRPGLGLVTSRVTKDAKTQVRTYRHNAPDNVLGYFEILTAMFASRESASPGQTLALRSDRREVADIEQYLASHTLADPYCSGALTSVESFLTRALTTNGVTYDLQHVPTAIGPEIDWAALDDALMGEVARFVAEHELQAEDWELPTAERDWVARNDAQVVYTDGGGINDGSFMGWAWYVDETTWASGTMIGARSGHAEKRAMVEAVEATSGAVLIVTDVDHPRKLVFNSRDEVHADLLARFKKATTGRQVRWFFTKGHANCPGNITADALVRDAYSHGWSAICTDAAAVAASRARADELRDQSRASKAAASAAWEAKHLAEHLRRKRAKGEAALAVAGYGCLYYLADKPN